MLLVRYKLSMNKMKNASQIKIIDITKISDYEKYPIPKGFRKKLLTFNGKVVGQIEYAPAEVSYYPIAGDDIIVMNCIWVLRKAKGHSFGKRLLKDMIESERDAAGFATIALENHWSPWFRKWQMEKLGFRPLDSIKVSHRAKHKGQVFSIHLMWMPRLENVKPPKWESKKFLEGITFCTAHPLYHPQTWKGSIFEAK